MRNLLCALLIGGSAVPTAAQKAAPQRVFTADIDHFWTAYDSVRTTSDRTKQLAFVQKLYVDKRSEGLAAFMEARNYSTERWVDLINKYPKFWASIRPNTLAVKSKTVEIEKSIRRFKKLYPELKEAKMYFTIGGLRSGGTADEGLVMIGTEIAAGNAQTDVSEFPDKWLATVFQEQSLDNVVALNVHEYVHTQQHNDGVNLLGQALKEGSCDFVAELVTAKPMQTAYLVYGKVHEDSLRQRFKQDMFASAKNLWLYNGATASGVADLGYFMGYAISKAYYNQAKNKQQALKDIIELDYPNEEAVEAFLKQSGYYPEGWNKAELLATFEAKQPVLLRTAPFADGATEVDASTKELVLHFSQPMGGGVSLSYGPRGKDYFPLKEPKGFSPDGKSFTIPVDLQPNHEYEFVVMKKRFKSKEGYPLRQDYTIRFKTK